MSWIDMHMHSNHSDDGSFSPAHLMALCAQAGVRLAALADHNSIEGVPEALLAAHAHGVELIPAVELDCRHEGVNLHVLGYGITPDDPHIRALTRHMHDQDRAASGQRMSRVQELGIRFDQEKVMALSFHGIVTGEMIAEVALADPDNMENALHAPYRKGGSRADNPFVNFYWDFCASGKAAHVPMEFIRLDEAVSLILQSGGVPVLAHPGNNIGRDAERLAAILSCGVKGIEVYSSYHDAATIDFYAGKARLHGVATTAGSDFHGKTKPAVFLGRTGADGQEDMIRAGLVREGIALS